MIAHYVEHIWAYKWVEVMRHTISIFEKQRQHEIPLSCERSIRDYLTDDVAQMYEAHPQLRDCWTF